MRCLKRLCKIFNLLKNICCYKYRFKKIGYSTVIKNPMKIYSPENISIGKRTIIEEGATLYSVNEYNGKKYNGKIFIGNNVYINHHFNATSANSIIIENDVLMAYNVSIFDFDHNYYDIEANINQTDLIVKGSVCIGEKSWIGMNVSILGNVKIGKHCVVGANSVVTKDIPDYSIAIGNPVKIIKMFNIQTNTWEKQSGNMSSPKK